jgi:hypothetical protein
LGFVNLNVISKLDSGHGACAQDINSPAHKFNKPGTMLGMEDGICVGVFGQDLEKARRPL